MQWRRGFRGALRSGHMLAGRRQRGIDGPCATPRASRSPERRGGTRPCRPDPLAARIDQVRASPTPAHLVESEDHVGDGRAAVVGVEACTTCSLARSDGETVEDRRCRDDVVGVLAVAAEPTESWRAEVAARRRLVRDPVTFGQVGFISAKATVEGHTAHEPEYRRAVVAGGRLVGPRIHPDGVARMRSSQRGLQAGMGFRPRGAAVRARGGRVDVDRGGADLGVRQEDGQKRRGDRAERRGVRAHRASP